MATTKKTPAKKAAAPKKTTKAKTAPVAEQVECIPKDPEPIKEPPVEMVAYVIPKDPGMESDDQFFEININGINYRFKRGEVLTHPRDFYEFIAYKLSLREHIDPLVAEFKDKSKKLN
jgi:hypothetical protein